MLIAIIIIIVVLANSCDEPVPGCDFPVECVSSCGAFDTTFECGACSSGRFESWMCTPVFDAGPPFDAPPPDPDAGSCDLAECFRPYECVFSCDDPEPSYVGCCECAGGTFDRVIYCDVDAGPPPDDGGPPGPDGGDTDGGDTDGGTSSLLPLGADCFDDRQCESGQCHGEIDASGMLATPTCHAACIPAGTTDAWCLTDRNCCGTATCSSEGACL